MKWDTQKNAWLFQFWEGDHTYRVVEESAPNGYSSADPVDYTFDSNGRVKLTGTVDSANARLISKDAINWNNYKWYVKNVGSFAFQMGSDGSITPINGVFGDAVTVTGNKISLNNASEKSVKGRFCCQVLNAR